jgi:hypothetical protein
MIGMTRARRRALLKAKANGYVLAGGLFADQRDSIGNIWCEPNFDRRSILHALVNAKLLEPGKGFGQYVLTDKGHTVVERFRVKEAMA